MCYGALSWILFTSEISIVGASNPSMGLKCHDSPSRRDTEHTFARVRACAYACAWVCARDKIMSMFFSRAMFLVPVALRYKANYHSEVRDTRIRTDINITFECYYQMESY